MEASNVTKTLFEHLDFRAQRQKIISSNIANLNTPNYKIKDVSFEDSLKMENKNRDLELLTTNNNHIKPLNEEGANPKIRLYEVENLQEQNDGNNVNLDLQMSEMSKNSVVFQALQASIKKDAEFFKSVIDSSAKN